MENKLQELTEKLYQEGLAKGRQQADQLILDAESAASKILSDARQQADAIKQEAQKAAAELKANSLAEITLAGRQAISTLKSSINGLITARSISDPVSKAGMDTEFVKELLLAVAGSWGGQSGGDTSLTVLLPAGMESKLNKEFKSKVLAELSGGVEFSFSDNIGSGFKISPQGGGYYIGFTDADFDTLLQHHLRGKVSQILYGQGE